MDFLYRMMLMFILLMILLTETSFSASVWKCCGPGEVLNLQRQECEAYKENTSSILLFDLIDMTLASQTDNSSAIVNTVAGEFQLQGKWKPSCAEHELLMYGIGFAAVTRIQIRDKIVHGFFELGGKQKFGTKFCLDHAVDYQGDLVSAAMVCSKCHQNCISVCDEIVPRTDEDLTYTLDEKPYSKEFVQMHCKKPKLYDLRSFEINSTGALKIDGEKRSKSEYCIDKTVGYDDTVYLCSKEDDIWNPRRYLLVILSIFSSFSLGALILIHTLIREFRKQPGTKLKMGIFWNLMILYLLLFIGNVRDHTGNPVFCVIIGIATQFFGLSTFFWMTILSVDVWNKFREMRSFENTKNLDLHGYLIFSVGGPALICVITALLQVIGNPPNSALDLVHSRATGVFGYSPAERTAGYVHPGIGKHSCFISPYLPALLYFHLIVAVLLFVNLIFFLLVIYGFFCGIWQSGVVMRVDLRTKIAVLSQVFILMGLNWFSEITLLMLSWTKSNIVWLSITLDVINLSTGILFLVQFLAVKTNREIVFGSMDPVKKVPVLFFLWKHQSRSTENTFALSITSTTRKKNATDTREANPSNGLESVQSPEDQPADRVDGENIQGAGQPTDRVGGEDIQGAGQPAGEVHGQVGPTGKQVEGRAVKGVHPNDDVESGRQGGDERRGRQVGVEKRGRPGDDEKSGRQGGEEKSRRQSDDEKSGRPNHDEKSGPPVHVDEHCENNGRHEKLIPDENVKIASHVNQAFQF